ncbi:transmembrane 6 superfamily member 1-like isoform X1 [Mytilus californianus]|uniref:transmembrane 6 superfamily member 1-like isoform X1 n=1 Tax=Mytilus californianus TaxID=6549 RepID=UPI0022461BAE|nr:transmembrane 6 superfamily member 1-like isoform X1 [Mytilus californianus]
MALTRFQVSFLAACLAFPILLLMKLIGGVDNAAAVFAVGIVSLLVVFLVPRLYFRDGPPKHDPFYNVWSIFLFASLVDITVALENDGYIEKYMHFYLLQGEPYLKTPFGTMINYWDGVIHFALVLFVLSRKSYDEEYRLACLFWCGSIINSVAVLVPGGAIGKFGPKWSILLNVPYVVIPLYILFKVLSSHSASRRNVLTFIGTRMKKGPVEMLFILFFVTCIVINAFRAAVTLGCKAEMAENYLKDFEPFLAEDTSFPKMQMLVYLFYFLPYYVYAIYRLLYPAPSNGLMKDLAVFHAGAAAQAQFVYLTTAQHSRTAANYRIPSTPAAQYCFWIINIALLVIPQLFAYRCITGPTKTEKISNEPVKEDNSSSHPSYNLRKRKQ